MKSFGENISGFGHFVGKMGKFGKFLLKIIMGNPSSGHRPVGSECTAKFLDTGGHFGLRMAGRAERFAG